MNIYITTPIYYTNDIPHIGHAYTTIACDIIEASHIIATVCGIVAASHIKYGGAGAQPPVNGDVCLNASPMRCESIAITNYCNNSRD